MTMARVLASLLVALTLVAAAGAKTITGTMKNDVLRGTATADTIHGKQGKDTLYGLGGNDLLVPGAGADIVYCGPGRDTVRADWLDAVARDCEVVTRPPLAPPGRYEGTSSQSERVTFEVVPGGSAVARFRINAVNQSCQPPDQLSIAGPLEFASSTARIGTARTFAYAYKGPGAVSGNSAAFDIAVTGKFVGTRASGTARFALTLTREGVEFSCSSGTVTWTAERLG